MQFEEAKELSGKLQSGSRGQGRRVHSVTEVRNFMCANIKRNDPITRRFLQYLSMQSCKVVVLIRDAKTSKILRSPPDDELWLNRHKAGVGRASKNEWTVGAKVGPKFFEQSKLQPLQSRQTFKNLTCKSGRSKTVAFRLQRIL